MKTGSSALQQRFEQHYAMYRDLPSLGQYYPTLLSPSREAVTLRFRRTSEGRRFINFASSNYLGINKHAEVREAYVKGLDAWGSGANGSPALSGYYEPHEQLERALAALHEAEDAVLFSSGYCANVSVISSCLGPKDMLVFDEAAHGSIIDGGKLAQTRLRSFPHNDPDGLRLILQRFRKYADVMIVATLGAFSMSGEIAPVPEIAKLAKEYDALLLLDDAHAVGVLGKAGRGTIEHFGLDPSLVDLCVGTLSKSLAGIGGYVVAKRDVTEFLRFNARPHVLSASIPPPSAAGCLAAVRILQREGAELSARLRDKAESFRRQLREGGIGLLGEGTGVAAFSVPDFGQLWRATRDLFENGIFLNPVLYPAVRKDEGRLRYYVNLGHTEEDLRRAASLTVEAVERSRR